MHVCYLYSITIIFSIFTLQSISQETISESELDSSVHQIMEEYKIPGVSAIMFNKENVLAEKQYGWSKIDADSISDSTVFILASSCKTIIATAIMQLWEKELFQLEDDISEYLPFDVILPNYVNSKITFKSLLTHTSGIKDNWNVMYFYENDSPISLKEFLENYFEPEGEYYDEIKNFNNYQPNDNYLEYSNVGAALLALLVEEISKMPFNEYCNEEIFAPLGMNKTSWFLSEQKNLDNIAIPYNYNYRDWNYIAYPHWGVAFYPAGQLRSTPKDLMSFVQLYMNYGEINNTRLLDSTTVDLITNTYVLNWQGLIWRYENNMWWHSGRSLGSSSMIAYSKETNIGIVYLTNGQIPNLGYDWRWDMTDAFVDYAFALPTSIERYGKEKENVVNSFEIFPNPFVNKIYMSYELHQNSNVCIDVFDLKGIRIENLINAYQIRGNYNLELNIKEKNLAKGMYYLVLTLNDHRMTQKIIKH